MFETYPESLSFNQHPSLCSVTLDSLTYYRQPLGRTDYSQGMRIDAVQPVFSYVEFVEIRQTGQAFSTTQQQHSV
jgi:hypothetical protein